MIFPQDLALPSPSFCPSRMVVPMASELISPFSYYPDGSTDPIQIKVKIVSFTQYAHSPSACKDEDYHVEKGGEIWYVGSGDHGTKLTI
jgi:hypothetical protein